MYLACIDDGGNSSVMNFGPESLGRSGLIYRKEECAWRISLEGKVGSDLEKTIKCSQNTQAEREQAVGDTERVK